MTYKVELKELIELQLDYLVEQIFAKIDINKNELITIKNKIMESLQTRTELKNMIKIPNFYEEMIEKDYKEDDKEYYLY
jgi:hypothetical protein